MSAHIVKLRNGMLAKVWPVKLGPWRYQGVDGDGIQHLWRFDGRWRENGTAHHFDFVTFSKQPQTS